MALSAVYAIVSEEKDEIHLEFVRDCAAMIHRAVACDYDRNTAQGAVGERAALLR